MTDHLVQFLHDTYGFEQFRPGQEAIIRTVLTGTDTLGILPTGSGKSLCYQLPTRMSGRPALIVAPLLALMTDQVARLQALGEKRAIVLSHAIPKTDFAQVLSKLVDYQYIFISPELLSRTDVLRALTQIHFGVFVIDEAHCISQWGPDFRPAYLTLGRVRQQLHFDALLALTATAPRRVRQDILKLLHMQASAVIGGQVNRPNIYLGVETVATEKDKLDRIRQMIKQIKGSTIIYANRRIDTEHMVTALQSFGIKATFYHAGLNNEQRTLIQRQFQADQVQVICATTAFGMGIDKSDVRLVVHTYIPESLESYYQAIGRAGRDGRNSLALLLVGPGDLARAGRFSQALPDERLIDQVFQDPEAYRDFDDPQVALIEAYIQAHFSKARVKALLTKRLSEKQAAFNQMAAFVSTSGCHRAVLLGHFDADPVAHDDWCCGPATGAVVSQVATQTKIFGVRERQDWHEIFDRIFPAS